jgi:putative solute:sodium symporter small subunit
MQPPSSTSADPTAAEPALDDIEQQLWRRRMRWTGGMLLVWFAVTFVVSYFARDLSVVVWGWPLSFWVAAQGALIVYLVLVLVFARRMGRLDEERDAQSGR